MVPLIATVSGPRKRCASTTTGDSAIVESEEDAVASGSAKLIGVRVTGGVTWSAAHVMIPNTQYVIPRATTTRIQSICLRMNVGISMSLRS